MHLLTSMNITRIHYGKIASFCAAIDCRHVLPRFAAEIFQSVDNLIHVEGNKKRLRTHFKIENKIHVGI